MRARAVRTALLLAGLAPAAFAAERVTLRNGFTIDCDHHATVNTHVRIYLGRGESSYIELKQEEVAAVESVPDPPAPVAAGTAKPAAVAAEGTLNAADLHQMLSQAGTEHNVDVDLLASVVKAESGGHTRAVSHAGAKGLMQLMPATAADLGVQDAFAPGENVRGGTAYLDALLTRYHENIALALAAYNAGPAAVDKYHGMPPYHETQAYVARVIHEFNRRVRARESEARHAAQASPAGVSAP